MKNYIAKLSRNLLLSPALILSLAASLPLHAAAPQPITPAATDDSDYATGTRAMNDQHWQQAIASFDKVIDSKDKRADAALYWKAYSLNKIGRAPLALATCSQLHAQYRASSWNKDCDALAINLLPAVPTPPTPPAGPMPPVPPVPSFDFNFNFDTPADFERNSSDPKNDLKILALNSLLNQDPAKAIPILRSILTGNQSTSVKKQAIFVLAQSKSPEAQSILHDAVTGKMDPELQRQAIQMMAIFQGKRANDTLAEVYRNTTDPRIKRSIISALFITQDAPRMVDLARNEKDLNIKRNIVSQLALMHDKAATDYMMELLK